MIAAKRPAEATPQVLFSSSSFKTARNASVSTCTVPSERIFFFPVEKLRFQQLRPLI
jgi:hypothetical protein